MASSRIFLTKVDTDYPAFSWSANVSSLRSLSYTTSSLTWSQAQPLMTFMCHAFQLTVTDYWGHRQTLLPVRDIVTCNYAAVSCKSDLSRNSSDTGVRNGSRKARADSRWLRQSIKWWRMLSRLCHGSCLVTRRNLRSGRSTVDNTVCAASALLITEPASMQNI